MACGEGKGSREQWGQLRLPDVSQGLGVMGGGLRGTCRPCAQLSPGHLNPVWPLLGGLAWLLTPRPSMGPRGNTSGVRVSGCGWDCLGLSLVSQPVGQPGLWVSGSTLVTVTWIETQIPMCWGGGQRPGCLTFLESRCKISWCRPHSCERPVPPTPPLPEDPSHCSPERGGDSQARKTPVVSHRHPGLCSLLPGSPPKQPLPRGPAGGFQVWATPPVQPALVQATRWPLRCCPEARIPKSSPRPRSPLLPASVSPPSPTHPTPGLRGAPSWVPVAARHQACCRHTCLSAFPADGVHAHARLTACCPGPQSLCPSSRPLSEHPDSLSTPSRPRHPHPHRQRATRVLSGKKSLRRKPGPASGEELQPPGCFPPGHALPGTFRADLH